MKPAPFDYVAPASAEEAVERLARYAGDARLLAGGQSLIALMNLRIARPAALIDLGRCPDLVYLREEVGWVVFGAMTRQATAEQSELVRERVPLIARTMPYLGHPTIRNRGTIGGTLAHADRVAELPGTAVALGAELVAQGPNGRRTIPAEQFFVGDLTTSLAPDEMLREARFPVAPANARCAFVEASNRHHDLAIVGIAAQLDLGADGGCKAARIAAIGVGPTPARLRRAEARLTAGRVDHDAIREAAELALEDAPAEGDLYASSAYRRRVTVGLVERALREAVGGDGKGAA